VSNNLKLQVLDVKKIKMDFPILNQLVNGHKLVYLDSAATSQKPRQVIDAMNDYYSNYNSNVHRGVHKLSAESTEKYEQSRKKVAEFINAKDSKEIIFTKNATEAINLFYYSWALENLKAGDEVITTEMEHHSNLVPWQNLQKRGVKLNFVSINSDGLLSESEYENLLSNKTKLVTVTHVSNVLGTINDIQKMAKLAHDYGSVIFIDGAQSVPHMPIDVRKLDVDFLAFSGHKMLGPTGIGVLYGKASLLNSMNPFLYGGDMIKEVHMRDTIFNSIPYKFEAGTPPIAEAIGLGAAIDYLRNIGMKNVRIHERNLINYALDRLSDIKDLVIYGPMDADSRCGVIAFNLGDVHAHDLASVLDDQGIAVRSGHHCAMPLIEKLGVPATARASFYIYNNEEDIDRLVDGLNYAKKVFRL